MYIFAHSGHTQKKDFQELLEKPSTPPLLTPKNEESHVTETIPKLEDLNINLSKPSQGIISTILGETILFFLLIGTGALFAIKKLMYRKTFS